MLREKDRRLSRRWWHISPFRQKGPAWRTILTAFEDASNDHQQDSEAGQPAAGAFQEAPRVTRHAQDRPSGLTGQLPEAELIEGKHAVPLRMVR